MKKKLVLVVAALIAVITVTIVSAARLYPLEVAEARARLELFGSGVRSFEVPTSRGEIHVFSKNNCAAGAGCSCALLVHGAADTAMTWKKLLTASSSALPGLRLYAVDLPGSGDSPAPKNPADLRVRTQAETLKEVLTPLQCSKWIAVGNSFGGWVAEWLAIVAKDKVDRLVIVDGAGLRASLEEARKTTSAFEHPSEEAMKEFQRKAYAHPRPIPEYVWAKVVERMKRTNSADLFSAQVADDAIDSHFSEIEQPTLVVWGDADQVIPRSDGVKLAHAIPHARLATLGDCGHLPQKECPAQLMLALQNFLKRP